MRGGGARRLHEHKIPRRCGDQQADLANGSAFPSDSLRNRQILSAALARHPRGYVLNPKLSCSLQANENGASGHAVAAVDDCARPLPDAAPGIGGGNRDEPVATFADCRGRLADTPDHSQFFAVIIGPTPTLALRLTADFLLGTI